MDGRWVFVPAAILAVGVAYVSSLAPIAALAALATVLVLILVFNYPFGTLLLLIAALPWEGMLAYPSETVSVAKLAGLLLLISFLISFPRSGKRLYVAPTSLSIAAFVLFVAISLIFSPDPAAGVGKLVSYALFAGFFFLVTQVIDDRERLLTVLRVLALSLTAAAIWGLARFLSGDLDRAGGPITNPVDFGYLLAAFLPIVVYLMLEDSQRRGLWLACIPPVIAAILATLSRGALIGLAALLAWGVATRRIRLGGLIAAALTLVAVVGVGLLLWGPLIRDRVEQKQSVAAENVQSREALWRGAVLMAMDNPITGVGPNRYGPESVNYVRDNPVLIHEPVAHNAYLEILAESGPFALAAFLAFLGGSWLTLAQQRRASRGARDPTGARLATALQASLLVAIVGALFLSEQLTIPFWLIGALAAVAPRAFGTQTPRNSLHP
jgi:putative inorganic carbon (HCO3(-)) transporter